MRSLWRYIAVVVVFVILTLGFSLSVSTVAPTPVTYPSQMEYVVARNVQIPYSVTLTGSVVQTANQTFQFPETSTSTSISYETSTETTTLTIIQTILQTEVHTSTSTSSTSVGSDLLSGALVCDTPNPVTGFEMGSNANVNLMWNSSIINTNAKVSPFPLDVYVFNGTQYKAFSSSGVPSPNTKEATGVQNGTVSYYVPTSGDYFFTFCDTNVQKYRVSFSASAVVLYPTTSSVTLTSYSTTRSTETGYSLVTHIETYTTVYNNTVTVPFNETITRLSIVSGVTTSTTSETLTSTVYLTTNSTQTCSFSFWAWLLFRPQTCA